MTSAYAVRLYDLLAQYRQTRTRESNLAWLRDALQIEPGEYDMTADLKKWVIDVSIEQSNKHTDLFVSYEPTKTGRAITDFAFKITEQAAKPKRKVLTDQQFCEQLEAKGQQRIDGGLENFFERNF